MKIKIYLFRLAVAFTAFVFGIGFFNVGQYFQSVFSTKEQKVETVVPVKIEEITYPPDVIEHANAPVFEQTDAADSEENIEHEFDATGDYLINGDLPKGFEDFGELSITTNDYENVSEENDYKGNPIPPEGFVFVKKKYKFARINIASKQIAFQTETKKGISYKFIGEFIDDHDYSGEEGYADLEGHLTKMRNGKKIAESKVKLVASGC
jgi:hypothetical protein